MMRSPNTNTFSSNSTLPGGRPNTSYISGHCKKLAPEYAKAAKVLAKQDPPLTIAKVDATENEKLAEEFGIKSFPTLKWLTDFGKTRAEYEGGRTESEIVNWINKRTGPASKQLANVEELEEAKKKNKLTVVYLGTEDSAEFKTYESVARSLERQTFYHMSCDAGCAESLKSGNAKVILFKPFDEGQNNYEGELTQAGVRDFLNDNSVPRLIEFSEEYVEDIFGKSKTTLFLFADVNSEAYPAQKESMAKLSEEFKGKMLFSVSDVKEGMQQRLAEFLGVKGADLPTAYILKFGAKGIKKYKIAAGTIDLDTLKQFISDYEENKLTPTLKSQEPPAEPFENDVKVHSHFKNLGTGRQDIWTRGAQRWQRRLCEILCSLVRTLQETGSNLVWTRKRAQQERQCRDCEIRRNWERSWVRGYSRFPDSDLLQERVRMSDSQIERRHHLQRRPREERFSRLHQRQRIECRRYQETLISDWRSLIHNLLSS